MPICYVCETEIAEGESADRVPPEPFYAKSIRTTHNPDRLVTRPTHPACNHAYGSDEECFGWALVLLALDFPGGRAPVHNNADSAVGRPQ